MIRRDYILRHLDQFAAMLSKIAGLAKNERWQESAAAVSGEVQRLTGVETRGLLRLSELTLLARLIENEPAIPVESKIFMLVTLLKTEGDSLAAQGRAVESREFQLKGLHLLFEAFGRAAASERPDFVPTVETFLAALSDEPLPVATNAVLMRHYEQLGQFSRAEDALFEIVDAEPSKPEVLEFARSFYRRLLALSDDALALGNLPRAEVQAGLDELNRRG